MRNSLKAAIASGGAAFLMLGGAGSLAYWQTAHAAAPGSLQSGRLGLTPAGDSTWTLNGNPVTDPATVKIVPGDELAWAGGFLIDAEGDNVKAEVALTGVQAGGTLAPYVTTDISWQLDGAAPSPVITNANDDSLLTVLIDVDFPFTASNDSQAKTLDLTDVNVTLTQVDATPAAA